MAKADEAQEPHAKKYDEKLAVKGSFLHIIMASVKEAEDKTAPKKEGGMKYALLIAVTILSCNSVPGPDAATRAIDTGYVVYPADSSVVHAYYIIGTDTHITSMERPRIPK